MGQARCVGSRKHPTGPMPQYQQEERRFCTCYNANPRQSLNPESSFCPWPTVAASLTVGTGRAGAGGPITVVVHHWCQSSMSALFFSSQALIEKNVKVEPKMWSMGARTLLESYCRLGGREFHGAASLSHTCIWMALFSKSVCVCLFSYFDSVLWFLPFFFLPLS